MSKLKIDTNRDYKYGFTTDIETFKAPKGLNENTIKFISKMKKEPSWMLEWRLSDYARLQKMKEPDWQKPKYPKIDYQDLYYYSAPKNFKDGPKSLDEIDPEIKKTYTPDFPIKNFFIIETKGAFNSADRKKMKTIKLQNPELDIRFIFSNSKTKIGKKSKTTYGKWCELFGFRYHCIQSTKQTFPQDWLIEIKGK